MNRARCEAPLRRRGAAVSVSDQRELVADTPSGEKGGYNGLFASYFRALDDKPLITKVCGRNNVDRRARQGIPDRVSTAIHIFR